MRIPLGGCRPCIITAGLGCRRRRRLRQCGRCMPRDILQLGQHRQLFNAHYPSITVAWVTHAGTRWQLLELALRMGHGPALAHLAHAGLSRHPPGAAGLVRKDGGPAPLLGGLLGQELQILQRYALQEGVLQAQGSSVIRQISAAAVQCFARFLVAMLKAAHCQVDV